MSSEARAIFGHARFYAIASAVNLAAGLVVIPVYTHYLPPAEYGTLGLITATSEIMGAFIGLKLGVAMSRIYFDQKTDADRACVVTTAFLTLAGVIAAVTPLLALVARPLASLVLGEPGAGNLVLLGVVAFMFNLLFNLALQYLQIRQRSGLFLGYSIFRTLGYLSLNTFFVIGGWGVKGALLGTLIINAATVAILVLPTLVTLRPRFSSNKLRPMLRFAIPLIPGQFAELLVVFTDRYFLRVLGSLNDTGIYMLAFRFASLLSAMLTAPFSRVYLVRRLEAHRDGAPDTQAAPVYTAFFCFICWAALTLSLVAPEAVAIVSSEQYRPAAAVIPLIALAQVLLSMLQIVELGLYYAKRSQDLTYANLATIALHIPLNALLISRFGVAGAAAAGCTSTAFRVGVTYRLARRHAAPRPEWARLARVLVAAVLCFALGRAADRAPYWASISVRAAIAAGFPLLITFGPCLDPEGRRYIRTVIESLLGRARARERDTFQPAPIGVESTAP